MFNELTHSQRHLKSSCMREKRRIMKVEQWGSVQLTAGKSNRIWDHRCVCVSNREFEWVSVWTCARVCACVCGLLARLLCVGFGCWFDYSVFEPRTSGSSVCHSHEPRRSRCVHSDMKRITNTTYDTYDASPAVTGIIFSQVELVMTNNCSDIVVSVRRSCPCFKI